MRLIIISIHLASEPINMKFYEWRYELNYKEILQKTNQDPFESNNTIKNLVRISLFFRKIELYTATFKNYVSNDKYQISIFSSKAKVFS